MNISKIFQHFTFLMLLFCDLDQAFAASAYNDDSSIYKLEKPKETVSYVEYHKDHEISEMQARASLRNMKESDFAVPAHCKPCKPEHKRYCHSENLLKDHCCCNMSHSKEQLYFIPHTCYINEDRCTPTLGSCLTVMDIRNCCCDSTLKRQWKSLLSNADVSRSNKYLSLMLALAIAYYR